jgi:hypothetical protein
LRPHGRDIRRLHRRRLALALSLLAVVAFAGGLALAAAGPGASGAAAAAPAGEVTPQTDDSLPASRVTMFGAAPAEAPDEAWGIGSSIAGTAVVRYTDSGWTLGPPLQDSSGAALESFSLAHPEAGTHSAPSPLAGQMTDDGSGALLGSATPAGGKAHEALLVRDPGGAFKEVPEAPAGEAALQSGEQLFGASQAPMVAALDEGGGHAGALVVPVDEGGERTESSVLHWNGEQWTREQIEVPAASSKEFTVIALAASSPTDAWLLARLSSSYPAGSVGLYRRHVGSKGEAVWQAVTPTPGGEAGGPLQVPVTAGSPVPLTVAPGTQSQILTATSDGVWVDGIRTDSQSSATMFLRPTGEASAQAATAWCSGGSPACAGSLPAALPQSGGRSFAWAGAGFGERVIAGLPAGVSLRLEGETFKEVLALGGTPTQDVGGSYGAAFASAREGWLGQVELPVHLTMSPLPSQLTNWPVPFRHALLALAPQPGVPVGVAGSQALAVGDRGEVARYQPGTGWLPESLGIGKSHPTPRLRAVAWPRPARAYAVGDEGAMWLWRGETGLWEPDPGAPVNFQGNLLGIAFDPANSARGYAVGESGVLLKYGKTWQQEPLPAGGPCTPSPGASAEERERCSNWQDASFTSIAFAGSEAIVAYRVLLSTHKQQYLGGLLVNSGSGWHIDAAAAAALGTSTPYAVAGLPDGGAAMGVSGAFGGALILERESAAASWQPTPTPYPGRAPGSLTAFREGGQLRVVATGTVPDTAELESEEAPPPGSPPIMLRPYPIETPAAQGVLRQTASGWSDQEHELNNVKEPPGHYAQYDTVYQPDPVLAVMVDETGAHGWAVGGFVNAHGELDTADVSRYPNDGTAPPAAGTAPIEPVKEALGHGESPWAMLAVGGGDGCAAPCAAERNARLGPDTWLTGALSRASAIAGVSSFLYTGPRLTTAATAGPATLPVPFEEEMTRYGELIHTSPAAVAVPSATDLVGSGSESAFRSDLAPAAGFAEGCVTAGCSHYAFNTGIGPNSVRVIVLDTNGPVEGTQLAWLESELNSHHEPRIVVGSADVPALVLEHVTWAQNVASVLLKDEASAYFFDAPEENVKLEHWDGSVPAFGSGTLGYVNFRNESRTDFHGASGFMVAEVGKPGGAGTGERAKVNVRLIPNIAELAIEPVEGEVLQRSQVALFEGLARRARAGNDAHNQSIEGISDRETDPYIPIPENCVGASCVNAMEPEYEFVSSRKDIGDFVAPNPTSTEHNAVLLDPKTQKPIPDAHSGLLCAYNKGETTVTLKAGGLSSSMRVKVEPGSVRRPCGTTKLEVLPEVESAAPAPAPSPAPTPASAAPAGTPPPIPLPPPPAAAAIAPPVPVTHPAPTFFVQAALPGFVPAILPPPVPTPARPTPPSGFSAVTQPVEAPEKEEEEEAAPESVSNEASAYVAHEHEPDPAFILGLVVLAAFAGAGAKRRIGRRRRELRVAPATVTAARAQRRSSPRRDPWR